MEKGTNRIANCLTKGEDIDDAFGDDRAFGMSGESSTNEETEDILRKFVSFGKPPASKTKSQEEGERREESGMKGEMPEEEERDLQVVVESVLALAARARQAVYDLELENEALAKELETKDEQLKTLNDQSRKAKRRISDLEKSREGYKEKLVAEQKLRSASEREREALRSALEEAEARAKAAAEIVETRYSTDIQAPAEFTEALADSPFFEIDNDNPPAFSMPK